MKNMNLNITGHTGLLCLLGHPAKHSISPKMHNEAFSLLGLDNIYLAFDVTEAHLEEAIASLRLFDAKGWNLTMPHKKAIIPFLDEISQISELTESVNTVINKNGKLYGTTTDGIGYIDSLKEKNFDISHKTITVLGAGGAAKSIIAQCALDGAKEIFVFKRKNATFSDTVAFANEIQGETGCTVTVCDMDDKLLLKEAIQKSQLLTNATNVGMEDDKRSLVPKEFLRKDLFVSDIIYHPAMTTLLNDAKDVGATYLNGEYMLLYQGAAAFELWTGQKMPVEEIKRRVFQ